MISGTLATSLLAGQARCSPLGDDRLRVIEGTGLFPHSARKRNFRTITESDAKAKLAMSLRSSQESAP